MPAKNRELARILQEMADIQELLGENRFKVIAYQKAARVLDEHEADITAMQPEEIAAIDGIGKGMLSRIDEFCRTGRIADHQTLIAQVPSGVVKLTRIPGLGPKTVATLWREGGVTDVPTLAAKIQSGELEKLPRLGKKKLEQIRMNLEFVETASQRLRIGQAMPLAEWLCEQVRAFPGVQRVDFAGSLRRGKETIGDLDLLCLAPPEAAAEIAKRFTTLDVVTGVIGVGPTKSSVRVSWQAGAVQTQVDLRIVPPESYGAAMMYFTGSKEHNVALRQRAIDRGLRLNEYGLMRGDDHGHRVAGATEDEVYRALDLHLVPPELREDHGEIALAEKGALPALVTLDDIKAELHSHTTASDGVWSVREWAEVAIVRGYHTIAITDHSKSQYQANGLSEARLERHIEDVRAVAKAFRGRLTILAGAEVDILSDGKLDYADSLLKELDLVVASPHSPLKQEPDKATVRLLRAIENPYVSILGHATGRLIGRREGLQPDMTKIVKAAAQRGIALEINANHYRLDIRDTHARLALDAGCMLAINTDAHGEGDLGELRYGVLTARRAGATPDRVVNCYNPARLKKWLTSTRKG